MKQVRQLIEGRSVFSTSPDANVLDVARTMTEKNIGAMPVIEDSRLVGIFSERDLMTRVVSRELSPSTTRISDVMSGDVASVTPDENLVECIDRMQKNGYRHLPVMEGDDVIGMISLRDLLDCDRQNVRHEKEILAELVQEPIYDV